MSSFHKVTAALLLAVAAIAASAAGPDVFPGIGRAATPSEVAAWDIDVRPDFKGLPAGSGTVAKGQAVWEGKCASCHGVFGESNEVFSPLVGGTTADDIKTGRVANLKRNDYPGRTTLMKVSSLSTLWDYINRAMPWNQPKSLSVEEVYSVTAYLLNLGGILPDDFTLSDKNMREVQQRLPNRNGTTTAHALWPGKELGGTSQPDVAARACMSNCAVEPKVASILPAFARNAHGNLAEQTRAFGSTRGVQTSAVRSAADTASATGAPRTSGSAIAPIAAGASAHGGAGLRGAELLPLLQENACSACHAVEGRLVGPSFREIAGRYQERPDAVAYLAARIRAGGQGAWGNVPMPAQTLAQSDAERIAQWLAAGAPP